MPDDRTTRDEVGNTMKDSGCMLPMGVAMIKTDYMSGGLDVGEGVRRIRYATWDTIG